MQLTATIGLPSVCRVHYKTGDDKKLYLIMAWRPLAKTSGAYTWLTAQVGEHGPIAKALHLGIERSLPALESRYGVAYTRPFDPCRVDAFGYLSVARWVGAYPATGKARALPRG